MATSNREDLRPQATCALRALKACDGHNVWGILGRGLSCYCALQELAEEMGWSGAAESAARFRRALVAELAGLEPFRNPDGQES